MAVSLLQPLQAAAAVLHPVPPLPRVLLLLILSHHNLLPIASTKEEEEEEEGNNSSRRRRRRRSGPGRMSGVPLETSRRGW